MLNGIVQKIKEDFIFPLVRRVSSNGATALATYGATSDQIETFEGAMIILIGVIVDLLVSRVNASNLLSWSKK